MVPEPEPEPVGIPPGEPFPQSPYGPDSDGLSPGGPSLREGVGIPPGDSSFQSQPTPEGMPLERSSPQPAPLGSEIKRTQAPASSSAAQQPWSPELIKFLCVSVLLFISMALVLATVLLLKNRASSTAAIKIFGVLTIVGMSALLVIAAYSSAQLTPIIGLFGAIAGYLLGKDNGAAAEAGTGGNPPPT